MVGGAWVLNAAISLYFADAPLASAFVARPCVGSKAETAGGVFQVQENEPPARVGATAPDVASRRSPGDRTDLTSGGGLRSASFRDIDGWQGKDVPATGQADPR